MPLPRLRKRAALFPLGHSEEQKIAAVLLVRSPCDLQEENSLVEMREEHQPYMAAPTRYV